MDKVNYLTISIRIPLFEQRLSLFLLKQKALTCHLQIKLMKESNNYQATQHISTFSGCLMFEVFHPTLGVKAVCALDEERLCTISQSDIKC